MSMPFGRSNSLTLNTSATNSLFAQQQSNPNGGTTQPQTSGGSNLFGGTATTRSQSLFGTTATTTSSGGTSLFGGTTGVGGGGGTSTLFGGQQNQQNQQQGTSSLFGGQQNQPAQGSTSLFGGQQSQPQQQTSSLFGGQQNQQGTSSLFGGQQNQPAQGTSSLFGGQQNQQQQQPTASLFGLTATQPSYNQPASLLGASQYRANQYPPFAGRLTMGQQAGAAAAGGTAGSAAGGVGAGNNAQGAVQINFDTMRPTTRFDDCIPDIQSGLEKMDAMIAAQERFCRQIEAIIPKHGDNVRSLRPDVELITEKVEGAELAMSNDARQVEAEKAVLFNDGKDGERVTRVVDNLKQPREYHYSGLGQARSAPAVGSADGAVVRDMDLIGNYFAPLTSSLQNTVNAYGRNLAEIEQHLRVIEASAVAQAQQLAAKRAGVRADQSQNGEETVRELADTLRGFEASILGAASQVGQCRDGLNELVLGRLGR